jgi:hypothetical protein
MVQVDFSEYRSWSTCPVWWKNFVDFAVSGRKYRIIDHRNADLNRAISKFNARIIDYEGNTEDIDYLEFETEEDFNAFKLIWTLYGK